MYNFRENLLPNLGGIPMIKYSFIGKCTLSIGLLLFLFGIAYITGILNYSELAPNPNAATVYIALGISMIFTSSFFKVKKATIKR